MPASPTSPAGIPSPSDPLIHEALTRWVGVGEADPAAALAAVVARAGDAVGVEVPFVVDGTAVAPDPEVLAVEVDEPTLVTAGPWLPGFLREALVPAELRRTVGVHHTDPAVAAALIGLTSEARPLGPDDVVADPAVGGGAFLLAALAVMTGTPADRLRRVRGCDLDPLAVATTAAALRLWADGAPLPDGALGVADGLDPSPSGPRPAWVVGNPPFGSQLRTRTGRDAARRARLRARWPEVGGYVDEAAAFLLAATERVADGGAVTLMQPASFLSARDAEPVRRRLADTAPPVIVWTDTDRRFTADVDTIACVCVAGATTTRVSLVAGVPPRPAVSVPCPDADSWGPLLAGPTRAPVITAVDRPAGPTLGDVAVVSSGFRDQYYGLRGAVVDDPTGEHPLVTVGLVDPLDLRWGAVPARFDRRRWEHPSVELDAVEPGVVDWLRRRLVPKLLVATQTRVIEAAVDPDGAAVPCTPVITVVPRPGAPSLAHLGAALTSPLAAADVVRAAAGSGLSPDAVRVSAPRLAGLVLPPPGPAWDRAAALVETAIGPGPGGTGAKPAPRLASAVGTAMAEAEGVAADDPVVRWWRDRLPRR